MLQSIPHGGKLINRILRGKDREMAELKAKELKKIPLTSREVSDLEMIATGAMSPLEGFMCKDDYHSVVDTMRLTNGLPWALPVTLAVSQETADSLSLKDEVALVDGHGHTLAILTVEDIFNHDKEKESVEVYKTDSAEHPGIKYLYEIGPVLVGGKIALFQRPRHEDFLQYRLPVVCFAMKRCFRITTLKTERRLPYFLLQCVMQDRERRFSMQSAGKTMGVRTL